VPNERADRLRSARLAKLLIDVATVDREAARRTQGFAVQPLEPRDDVRLDHRP